MLYLLLQPALAFWQSGERLQSPMLLVGKSPWCHGKTLKERLPLRTLPPLDGHPVGIRYKVRKLFMNHGVILNSFPECLRFLLVGKLPMKQKVHFQVVRFFCKLFNWVSAMQQYAFCTINESDLRFTGRGWKQTLGRR